MKKLLVLSIFLLPRLLQSQIFYKVDESINVNVNNVLIPSPWVGGLNSAEYNTMDLDNDQDEDLVLFDRMAQKILTFINDGSSYRYYPEYEAFFPAQITNWLLLRDFNNDGKKDIFTGDVLGIRVFRNVSSAGSLQWEHFPFFAGTARSEVVITKGLSGKINLQMQFDDLPSISDVDGDLDVDIFTVDFGGSGTVEFHKNFSMERYNVPDSLDFEMIDKSWGDFAECDCAEFAFNNEDCGPSGGRVKHAGGKSLLAIDTDGDSNTDILLSEAECDHLSLLRNEGTLASPLITSSELYPSVPASFLLYPTPYYEDVDHDGVKDLMVTPNIFSKAEPDIDLTQSNWFYKNVGSNANPDFQFIKKDFLQETMLDLGDNTVPALADLDGDGDEDLFVSSNNFPGTVSVFENTGTKTAPEFHLLDIDYLTLSQNGFRNLKIQFVDANNDNKTDLAFYGIPLNAPSPRLYIIFNKATGSLDFTDFNFQLINFSLSSQENLTLTDVNGDGNVDILRGRNNGSLEYWRNTGALNFTLENGQFLGIGSNIFKTNPVPVAGDLNSDGKGDLILTDHSGVLTIISDYKNAADMSNAVSDVIYNTLTEEFYAPNLGGRVWPAIVNIFGGKNPAIILGTSLGGLRILRPDNERNENPAFQIFPNPVNRQFQKVKIKVDREAIMDIYSVSGQIIKSDYAFGANQLTEIDFSAFPAAVYILRFTVQNKTFIKRLAVY